MEEITMTTKPFTSEDQYIWQEEQHRRLQKLAEQQRATSEFEKHRLKELHWMHCPKCGQALATETCGPVEIDVCPGCKGLWLDANELETIVAGAGQGSFFRWCVKMFRGD
jgi:hypothetical protein